jgi:hypothetical protein
VKDRESVLEMEKAIQYAQENLKVDVGTLEPKQVARESRLRSLYQKCPKAYEAWCVQYGNEPDAIRFAIFSNNYVAMREFAERSGKVLKLNKYTDRTKEEYARLASPPLPEELARRKAVADAKMAIQRAEAATLAEKRKKKPGTLFLVNYQKDGEEEVAVLSNWKQNADGSITGVVRNKEGLKDGTRITTSSVNEVAKSGNVVKTAYGSKYKLR